ncbi:hypothetical protein IGL98_002392 [Enterococcus sp. DIV0840]|uniref:T7SS effector LXG polymorphic toxin n=1 Tax=unclassified Enterococcus TaxID=2608891 RepID=UPI001A8FB54F|nr:T7SS effector LXG polymorphic toxin [Enterococcus sp. DIV0849a]MBO0433935.1 hypothetical protein [Enterococcus sp. DIV0849a]
MGLIYSSSDSSQLMSALKQNLQSGKEASEQLKAGSQKVISAVDGKTLSGAAYTAGKGLFSELILPTISKVTSAIDTIESELQTYVSADLLVSSEGTLDEDKLNQQIATKKAMKASVDASAAVARALSRNNPVAKVLDALLNVQSSLTRMSNDFEEDIRELEKKLEKLQQFSSQTNGLFSNSLNDMKISMQGVTVLNNTIVNSDGTYQLPKGVDLSWFNSLKNSNDIDKMEKTALEKAMKEINDLYSKNPMAAIEKVKNNNRLFEYLITFLDSEKLPKGIQDAVLDIFIAQESWNKLPKDLATKILNNPKFGLYLIDQSIDVQAKVYGVLINLSDKGWEVLAPIGHMTNLLSKSSAGEALIAGTKIGFNKFKKLGKVADFLKKYKAVGEVVGVAGDGFSIGSLAYNEYINPDSPAYGDISKALYGGQNKFFASIGPLEGAQYGFIPGAISGTMNYFLQGGGISDIPLLNKIPIIKNSDDWHTWVSKKDIDKWINEQYEIYDRRHENLESGNFGAIKEDWFGKQNGRVDTGDFNTGLPKW